ncbi:histidine kinase dimerization/phosphoacceptor domain-containing protein [Micromonospora sp. NPDC005222]|uniref:histidine kinase dimerization/phosphoacceptor domain-containing protein n=1 Tax=unclassified Micromonospora TaxID=2617518 RepID=UPI0033A4DE68
MNRLILGRPLRGVAFDAAACGLVVFFALSGYLAGQTGLAACAVGLAMAAVLFFRRAHPSAVGALVAALALVQVIAGWGPLSYDISVLIALYSVVKYADRLRDGIVAGVVAVIGGVLAALQSPGAAPWWMGAFFYALIVGAVWLAGLNLRTRRLYVVSLEERAATLEREREAEARAAVAEERTRIARELHDVVAHSMAVMIVQADGVRFTLDRDPATAREAVKVVADTGRQALEDMRRLVGVLREPERPESPPAVDEPAAEPAHRRPALVELPALLDRFRAAGLRITCGGAGTPAGAAARPGADRLPGGAGEPDQRAQARRRRRVGGADAGLGRGRRRGAGGGRRWRPRRGGERHAAPDPAPGPRRRPAPAAVLAGDRARRRVRRRDADVHRRHARRGVRARR